MMTIEISRSLGHGSIWIQDIHCKWKNGGLALKAND
jgi:hypothetical protein